VDDDKRGRVMSFHAMAFIGMAPLGSLIAGILAGEIGAPYTLLLCGIGCILGAIVLGRSLYELKEVLPPVVPEISTPTGE